MSYIQELLNEPKFKKHWHQSLVDKLPSDRKKDLSFKIFDSLLQESFLQLKEKNKPHKIWSFSDFHETFSVKITCELGYEIESFISEAFCLTALKNYQG